MKKYLYIAIALLCTVSCTKEYMPSDIEFSVDKESLNVQQLEDGRLAVTFDLPVKSFYENEIVATRTEATGTETVIADGWALLFGAADEADETNTDGYGHSSKLVQKTQITVNANGKVFFTLDQFPWVKEVEAEGLDGDGYTYSTYYYFDNEGDYIYYSKEAVETLRAAYPAKYTATTNKLTFEMLEDPNYTKLKEGEGEQLIYSSEDDGITFNNAEDMLQHLTYIRFIVNLTDDTQETVNDYVSVRMKYNIFGDYNSEGASGLANSWYLNDEVTTFEDYKHLSVGLDAYYQIDVDESTGALHGTPNPMGEGGNLGNMQEKYPMASPGFEMLSGVNATTLTDLNELTAVEMVHVGSKIDVTNEATADFTLHGVTLLNSAKRALMRSSVLENDGVTTIFDLPLPTNLYDPTLTPSGGVVQFSEVTATNNTTSAYPIYFFPNEGDAPNGYDGVDQHVYTEEFDGENISDPINGYNPTYLIIRGTFTASGEEGYYKVPIKYETAEDDATTKYTYDILRHNYFQMRITSVANAGYKTFAEAVAAPASDLKYDITIGDSSDDRNEYATSNGTFYIETDATEIFIKGYGNILNDESSEVDEPFSFNLTVVGNDDLNELDPLETVTKAGSYTIPDVYITTTDGVKLTDVYTGSTYHNTVATPLNYLTYTPTSAAEVTIEFAATAQGVIKVQCGDIFKEIPVYYEEEDYVRAGSISTVYPNSDTGARLTVNGVTAFTASNAIEYESAYTDLYDYDNDNATFGEFLTEDGYVETNVADENGGYFKRRECRAKVYRTEGRGIAKIYLKQASDFALLYGSASTHAGATTNRLIYEVGSTLTVLYNSKGYKYSVDGTVTSGSDHNNNPYVFYIAGSDQSDEMRMVTSDEVDNYQYNTTLTESGATTKPVKSFRSGNTLYTIDEDSQDEADVATGDNGYDYSSRSVYDASFGEDFSVWAYPILTNQTVPEDGSDWEYYSGFAAVDNTTTITLRNSAGESKEYILDFFQYALPFWDPTLTVESSSSAPNDYVVCQHSADAYNGDNTYSGDNVYGDANSSAQGTHNAIGAFTVYNANYRRGEYENGVQVWDFSWTADNYSDTNDQSNIINYINVQAYDDLEPELVVFAAYTNNYASSSVTNGRAYFTVTMYNDAQESTTMYMQINRNDTYCNTGSTYQGTRYTYFPFTYNTSTYTKEQYYGLLNYLTEPAYLSGI
ncbi:MAG: hypothetical protein SNH73_06160 [Rikenellaceae bacterium]